MKTLSITLFLLALAASTLAAPIPGKDASVLLSWTANTEADMASYKVFRAAAATGPWAQIASVGQPASIVARWDDGTTGTLNYAAATWPDTFTVLTKVTFTDVGVPTGKYLYYSVSAVDASGNESAKCPAAKVLPVDKTPPKTPVLTATTK